MRACVRGTEREGETERERERGRGGEGGREREREREGGRERETSAAHRLVATNGKRALIAVKIVGPLLLEVLLHRSHARRTVHQLAADEGKGV